MAALAWFLLSVALACVQAATFQNPYFTIVRAPVFPDVAVTQPTDKQCTAIYQIVLRPEYSTQGNDIGMLQPHGKNTTGLREKFPDYWIDVNGNVQIGGNYLNFPNPNDPVAQAYARALFSVTALTDPTGTPIGFKFDVMHMYYSVCVQVRGVNNRWVEIMAQTPQPDRKICVSDWRPDGNVRPNLNQNPFQASCGQGHLYVCRSSLNEQVGPSPSNPSGFNDNLNVRFYCEGCDDETFTFYWRIVASQFPPVNTPLGYVQPDGENFCLMRRGDDYPSSLLAAYPQNYVPPPVFELSTSSAMSVMVSVWVLVVLAVLSLIF